MQVTSKHKWPRITPKPPVAKNFPRVTTVPAVTPTPCEWYQKVSTGVNGGW